MVEAVSYMYMYVYSVSFWRCNILEQFCIYFWLYSLPVVLDSEVVDLRVCLRSADRELAELKEDMKKEKKAHDTKTMDLLRRVSQPKVIIQL